MTTRKNKWYMVTLIGKDRPVLLLMLPQHFLMVALISVKPA